ncbi:MAG: hypothetical protein QXT45_07730 [Candidatus Bilamarchaeaceae archaeon]
MQVQEKVDDVENSSQESTQNTVQPTTSNVSIESAAEVVSEGVQETPAAEVVSEGVQETPAAEENSYAPPSNRHRKMIHQQIKFYERRLKKVQEKMRQQAASIRLQSQKLGEVIGMSTYRQLVQKYTTANTNQDGKKSTTVDYTAINREVRRIIAENREKRIQDGLRKRSSGRSSDRKKHNSIIKNLSSQSQPTNDGQKQEE